jgi:CyaY protein
MNESEFDKRATDTLLRIEQTVEESGADIDFEGAGGILTLEFGNGSKIIINKQGAAKQIWVAARSGGFHYGYVDGQWINDQSGGELMSELSRLVREQSGEDVALS